jgi:type II secretory pathway component PulK
MPRKGTVLIAAMVIIFALVSLVLVLGQSMRVEATASANRLSQQQAAAVARGAEQYVLAMLSENLDLASSDEPRYFAAVPVGDGYFWILRPDYGDPLLPEYGIVDESSKLDINRAGAAALAELPGMNEEIATAIVQWRRGDDDEVTGGSMGYLDRPYNPKGAPFETVEELLLVRGMTRELLYGTASAAGRINGSASRTLTRSLSNQQYQENGIYDLLTVWSRSISTAYDGSVLTVLPSQERDQSRRNRENDQRRRALREMLRQRLPGRAEELSSRVELASNIFDFARRLQLTGDELAIIEPYISDRTRSNRMGRINVNTAPREVLMQLVTDPSNPVRNDGIFTASDVDALVSRRTAALGSNPSSIAWVLDAVGPEKATGIGARLTGRGQRYSADIVAVSGNGRAFKRVRIVIHRGSTERRIVYRRDVTDFGWPLDPQILASLRAGQRINTW